ncbi:CWF19-like protein 1 [Portunus trituberculatus]|uniref:CWF19-like protein 1 n=1 Tax=Portunus trituberculatus TaxID=210409 RepID=A0A5B7CEV7_PORTR|nr:CWF19-like protein 1 [Portunus trituberculatus]
MSNQVEKMNHKVLLEPTRHVTRFIGLAKVGNPEKQKWLYAFNITPMSKCEPTELVKQPPDRSGKDTRGAQFFYDMNAKMGDERGQKRKGGGEGGERKRLPPKPTGPCWFCLASPEVEKHLVVSVGDHTYLALAKGGLVSEHLLILPITHFQSTPDLDDDCLQEIEKFKKALKAMFKKKGKRAVFFERNYRSQHLQIQVVPVSNEAALHLMETFTVG